MVEYVGGKFERRKWRRLVFCHYCIGWGLKGLLLPQKAHLVVKLAGSVTVVVAVSLLVSDAKDGDLVQVSK